MSSNSAPAATEPLVEDFPAASREGWLKLVEKMLKGGDFERRLVARTADGLAVQPLYTACDRPAGRPRPLAAPALAARAWDIRQVHATADPKAANTEILEDLSGGATSVVLKIAANGQRGLPASPDAFATALTGVLLDVCPIALAARDAAPEAARALMAQWQAAGIPDAQRRGAFDYDPLGTLAVTGSLAHSPETALGAAAGLAGTVSSLPHVTALMADGRPYHEAGASEAQELAAMLATLVAYLRACEAAGHPPAKALPAIAVGLAADADMFATIAKLRAGRLLVGRVAEACSAGSAGANVAFAITTSERMLAQRDPWVNILRTATATAAAAFGGATSITALPFTWALGAPDAFARRVARNTHLVLQEESSLARVIDPAGGSFYVERLTDDMAKAAWGLFQGIEAKGGMLAVLGDGSWQAAVAQMASERAKRIATARDALTGVSAFPRLADDGVTVSPWPPAPAVTKGPISVTPLTPGRLAAPFEALRDAADAHRARTGRPLQVFLASLGDLSVHAARTTWMRNFLAAGGIAAVGGTGANASADVGAEFAESGATVACLCSSDAVYGELGEAAAQMLKTAGATHVLLAGRPKDQEAALKAAGVDTFLYAGIDAVDALGRLHAALGARA